MLWSSVVGRKRVKEALITLTLQILPQPLNLAWKITEQQ